LAKPTSKKKSMELSNGQEQLARLKKSNERLTILCIILGLIAVGTGLYARIQKSIANENVLMAAIAMKRAAEAKQKAELSGTEAMYQRKIADSLNVQLIKLRKEKAKSVK
jgi:hypothetical protein